MWDDCGYRCIVRRCSWIKCEISNGRVDEMWDSCGYWVYPKNRLRSAESTLKFVTWALHLGSSKRHVKASIMLELWVKEDTEKVAWSRWGKSIWFRWSQSHHWVLCPISCVVIVALNFMISSNDLRGVGWCYSGGTMIHEKMSNIYSTQEVE